jgi:alpha-ketoglutaric semialdehyde dehydrogenase
VSHNSFRVLINGRSRQARAAASAFKAVNPATGIELEGSYPVSRFDEAEEALQAAHRAVQDLSQAPAEAIADFLDFFAESIKERSVDLVEIAHLETALPKEPRLRLTELPRTTDQLHQAASAARERSWRRATIETKTNIRSIYGPLGGPIAIFGPNNFPFAFNPAAGGDFAAALAVGNPVIAKAHPGHPGTTRMFAEIALECLKRSPLPRATVQLIYHLRPQDGLKLVAHPLIGATAFTGSRAAGLRLKEAADGAGRPIYLEMSSTNPVFVLSGALRERPDEIAAELFASCSLAAGQFCTKPGLVVLVAEGESESFIRAVCKNFDQDPAGFLVSEAVIAGIERSLALMKKAGAEIILGGHPAAGPGYRFENTLLRATGKVFLQRAGELQQEAFGTVMLLVLARDFDEMLKIARALEGNLTASIFSHSGKLDDASYDKIEPVLRLKVGRLLNDKMPTGVAVVPSMVHGGPFPATGHPGFTSVGIPASMLRFAALRSYDNVRQDRLPLELRDKNPTGRMWRLINGEWTVRHV